MAVRQGSGRGSLAAPEAARTNGQPSGPQPLRRRRALPGSRAVVGGLLVAAAAIGLFAAYTRASSGPATSYVVVRHQMAAGARLSAGDLTVAPMDLPPELASGVFTSVDEVAGSTLIAPLGAGELVQPSALVAARTGGPGRVVSFPFEAARLGGLKQGERVDVVATYGTGADAYTAVVLTRALVVDVDRSEPALGDQSSAVLTLGLDDAAAEVALAHALQIGKLTVVVATGAPPASGPTPTYRGAPGGTGPDGRARS